MASLPSLASRWCGRRQEDEPPEEAVMRITPSEEEKKARQVQKDLFEAIENGNLKRIKEHKNQFPFKDIKDIHERTPIHVLVDLKKEKKVKDEDIKEIFKVLKEAGCDVDQVDEFGNTAVKLAAEKGCIQILKCLLEEKANINLSDKFKKDTPLHWAAKNGKFEATKLLIEHRAQLNPQNGDRQTPLHLAVQKKHKNIVFLLLLKGADKNLKDKNDFTPLNIAERANNKESKEIEDLLTKSEQELIEMAQIPQPQIPGRGEIVEPDSGSPTPIPWIEILPAQTQVNYNYFDVKVQGNSVAAIGPDAKVNISQESTTSQSVVQPLPPAPLPSTAGSIAASSPTAVAPTAPLSPMDYDAPSPSAPPEEEEENASSGR